MRYIRVKSDPVIRRLTLVVFTTLMFTGSVLVAQEGDFERFKVKNAYYITDLPKEKLALEPSQFGQISEKPTSFEDIEVPLKEQEYQYLRIGQTDEMLVLKSLEMIRREFKAYQRKKK